VSLEAQGVTLSPAKKRGRPRKADVESKKKRGVVGRPPGEAARIKEFYARLLSTSGEKVIETVLRKAMDDGEPVFCPPAVRRSLRPYSARQWTMGTKIRWRV